MQSTHLTRQADLIPMEVLDEPITVIGAGAIGSFTVLQLAKLGFENITVFDDDVVSDENMNSQFYRISDIGRAKVEALQEIVRDFTGTEITIHKNRYETGVFAGIVITAVDSMQARKLVFDNHHMKAVHIRCIIDPRMGAESGAVRVFSPMDRAGSDTYIKSLYSDIDAVSEPCTAKATMYTVNLLTGLVAKTVKDLLTGEGEHIKSLMWDIKSFALDAWTSLGRSVIPKPPELEPSLYKCFDVMFQAYRRDEGHFLSEIYGSRVNALQDMVDFARRHHGLDHHSRLTTNSDAFPPAPRTPVRVSTTPRMQVSVTNPVDAGHVWSTENVNVQYTVPVDGTYQMTMSPEDTATLRGMGGAMVREPITRARYRRVGEELEIQRVAPLLSSEQVEIRGQLPSANSLRRVAESLAEPTSGSELDEPDDDLIF